MKNILMICSYCNKEIERKSNVQKYCSICSILFKNKRGKKYYYLNKERYLLNQKKNNCMDCEKKIHLKSKRCFKCSKIQLTKYPSPIYKLGQKIKLCFCGYGEWIIYKKHHKYYGIPSYLVCHQPCWNTGLTKETHSGIRKISEKKKGNKYGLGKFRVKVIPKNCVLCGTPLTRKQLVGKKKYCSVKCVWKSMEGKSPWNKGLIGFQAMENHPNWKGGKSFEPYGVEFNNELRDFIRNMYGNLCQECFISGYELKSKLSVHHIDYDKKNCSIDNLIPLCKECHTPTNYEREKWEMRFKLIKLKEKQQVTEIQKVLNTKDLNISVV